MSASQREAPSNLRSLEARIRNIADGRGQPVRRIQRVVANTVVGQMLPDGVVKGGTALKIRVGEARSRFTPDLDASRARGIELDDYVDELSQRLAEGWSGFTGTLVELEPAQPVDVPPDYVMRPFEIRLAYRSRHWLTVRFELGHDEVGSTEAPDRRIATDILSNFAILGLEQPDPLPVMPVEHQVAQKLHACTLVSATTGRNERAHDLVDLQILDEEEAIDLVLLAEIGARLFALRRTHKWPPTIVEYEQWETIYAAAAEDLNVLPTVAEAVAWANDLVERAVAAANGR